MTGALIYGKPQFAAVITTVSLFIAFVLHKAYNPYRTSSALDDLPTGDAPPSSVAPKTSKLKYA